MISSAGFFSDFGRRVLLVITLPIMISSAGFFSDFGRRVLLVLLLHSSHSSIPASLLDGGLLAPGLLLQQALLVVLHKLVVRRRQLVHMFNELIKFFICHRIPCSIFHRENRREKENADKQQEPHSG